MGWPDRPDWAVDGKAWPNRAASRFVQAGGLRFHVQCMGEGPAALLLHGTGAATHSWAGLMPLLAGRFALVAPDLPGHGFSDPLPDGRAGPDAMGQAVAALLGALEVRPAVVVGHSAGAAIAVQMALDGRIAPERIVAVNGVILPLTLVPMHWLAPLARGLAATSLVPRLFAWHAADRRVVERLLRGTGSNVPEENAAHYARLLRRAGHAAGALAMMAHWDLAPMRARLGTLNPDLLLLVGERDRTVPPAEARAVLAALPGARMRVLAGLGHLAHEEDPALVAREIAAG